LSCDEWTELINALRGAEYQVGLITQESPVHRVQFADGLTDSEVSAVESRFEFKFPPDLRAFLQTALPCGPGFPDWRCGEESVLRDRLDAPRQGVLFDVQHNGFWLEDWGPQPASLAQAALLVDQLVAAAPKLIPVFLHRMMPDEPCLAGNPVLSIHQTDIIHYGYDLANYLRREFHLPGLKPWPEQIRAIRFWDPDHLQDTRWAGGPYKFDNSKGQLP
jgi:hypothetical protein